MSSLIAYVDGSFDVSVGRYGFGCILILPDGEIIERYGSNANADSARLRNVTGEMLGAMYSVKWALLHGFSEICICYDYTGIENWATGAWKAKTELTKKYAESMKSWGSSIKIRFDKIVAHTGVDYNERADKLAKKAIAEQAPIPDFK